jgi:16S rRNA (uracil1498-N3)-methyltransferase
MARRRFFVEEVRNGRAAIGGDDAHHLTRVLRVEAGQKYEISDTRRVWLATVETARKNIVEFAVDEELDPGPALPELTLYLALIKFDRFEWAVEKATELGVATVVPFEAGRTDRGLFDGARKRAERWRRIAKEASEQSRRLRPPEVADPVRFTGVLAEKAAARFWLDERHGGVPLHEAAMRASELAAALVIGPEGGWQDSEREQLAGAGWLPVSLGPMILRAETAVCAALAVLVQAYLERSPGLRAGKMEEV